MNTCKVSVGMFLEQKGTILDVRSPAEYEQAHIPGAINLPLFSNEERAQVGTVYKQEGQSEAIALGLSLIKPRMTTLVEQAKVAIASTGFAKVHCWRGGMRSESVASLLQACGISTIFLDGGYKAFRRQCLEINSKHYPIQILGGMTGSGKTAILHALRKNGEQILDLEDLAIHRGSAYGQLPSHSQPSNEQFENKIACALQKLDTSRIIWIEDESRLIGKCKIPDALYAQMQNAPLLLITRPKEERVAILEKDYSSLHIDYLIKSTQRISTRLGKQRADEVEELLNKGSLKEAGLQVLAYYDKAYVHSIKRSKRELVEVAESGLTDHQWAKLLVEHCCLRC